MERVLRALRGAITVDRDTPEEVILRSRQLTETVLRENGIAPDDIVSIIYTTTSDVTSEFPAVGARRLGLIQTPLMCAQEIPVPGSQGRCIRLMLHAYMPQGVTPRHIYLREAVSLRPDLAQSVDPDAAVAAASEKASTAPAWTFPARSALTRIEPYVPGKSAEQLAKERGVAEAIKLSSNENPFGPSPAAVEAIRRAASLVNIYPDGSSAGLRERLAERLGVSVDRVIIGCGSDELIKLMAEAYLNPGDSCAFADLTFSQYSLAAKLMDAREVVAPLDGDCVHDLDAFLEAARKEQPRLCFICNPNNPTGTYVPHDAVRRFLDGMAEASPNTLVVFDEAYYEYVTAPDFPRVLEFVQEGRHVALLRTFSKIYGLAGLRVGYGIMPRDVVAELEKIRPPFNVNLPAQHAAMAALEDEGHVQRSSEVNARERDRLGLALGALGWYVYPSQANFLFVALPGPARDVYEGLLERGIIVRGGAAFGRPECLRITVGTPDQNDRLISAVNDIAASISAKGAQQS